MATQDEVLALIERATAAAQGQQLDEATALLDQVLDAEPDNVRAHDLYGFVLFFQGRFVEGEAHCRRTLELKPDHAYGHKGLGLHLAKQGRLEEGVAMLEKAMALMPEWLDPYWDLAVTYHEAKRPADAIATLERGKAAIPAAAPRFDSFIQRLRSEGDKA